ncbi:UDP-glucose 4-epimerase-like [Oratosquilla oratoria]|uniref:UDP-glucose 4-epimerase-like n=1 Tax=Oratosquilla oratoria TaxID=337810 RepID=UPI003F765C93
MVHDGQSGARVVLLTGGAGFVGSHTAIELLERGDSVVVVDNCVNAVKGGDDKPVALQRVEELTGKTVKYHEASMLDCEALDNVFKQYKVDVVIHFAALKSVGESVDQPLRYYGNNITGTLNLLQAMSTAGVKRLVFSSSATVYGTPQYLPIDESHPTGQGITNPYGQTKFMCEQIMMDLARADPEWRVVLLRYFNPVGAHPSGRIGEDPRGIPNNLMPTIAQVAVERRPNLYVYGNDFETVDGTGVRDYVHVVDLARGHVAALSKLWSKESTGTLIYNLGTGQGISVLQMIEAFSRACGKKLAYKITSRRKGDVGTVVATCELAKKELGWVAERSLEDMCVDTWRWQSNNPNGFSI